MIAQFEQFMQRMIDFNLFTDNEEELYKNFMLYIEQNLKLKTEYILFINSFNEITGKKYKPDTLSRQMYYEQTAFYTLKDRVQALKHAITDPYLIEKNGIITPVYMCKPETIAKYINYKPVIKSNNEPEKPNTDKQYNTI